MSPLIQVSIAVPKAKLEAERGFHRGGPPGPGGASAAGAQGSIADNLPPSALASLVSKVRADFVIPQPFESRQYS